MSRFEEQALPGQFWGDKVYSDKTRVPRAEYRCTSEQSTTSNAHRCKLHGAHQREHRCICGATWTKTDQAVTS